MGSVKVSDISSFFQGTGPVNDIIGRKADAQDAFTQVMSTLSSRATGELPDLKGYDLDKTANPEEAAKRIRKSGGHASDMIGSRKDDTAVNNRKASEISGDEKAEMDTRLKNAVTKVKEAVKEELGVSDEEIELVMEQLGFVQQDLLNADNLKSLMLELSGEQDAMALITNGELLNSIGNVQETAMEEIAAIADEFGMETAELEEFIELNKSGNAPETTAPAAEEAIVTGGDEEDGNSVTGNAGNTVTDLKNNSEVTVNDTDDGTKVSVNASAQRKNTEGAGEDKGDGGMQNAMQGQSFTPEVGTPEVTGAAQTEFVSSYVDNEDILRQINDGIRLNINGDTTEMELRLHPASLGTVNLQISSTNGVITANLQVQNETVKAILETQLVQLLETFEEQGQKVEAIEVSVAGYDLDRSLNQGNNTAGDERRDEGSPAVGRTTRRRLNLNELDEEGIEELTEEEQLAAEMMAANGGSVDYLA